jgi:hypothetical protein
MGHTNATRLLLSLGADLNVRNSRNAGETPLELARVSGNGTGMGFDFPPEVRLRDPGRHNRPAEARTAVIQLLEEAAAAATPRAAR